ncbi:MAG: hypothetical protein KDA53_06660, partial [Hyphomonas sp.]|nr:hypothetical protein [Hyphomonas sp.]
MLRPLVLSLIVALGSAGVAVAAVPGPPSLKPARTYASDVTDPKNAEILYKALEAAERYDWQTVASMQRQATDPAVRDLIMW